MYSEYHGTRDQQVGFPKIQDACLWGNKDALHEAPVAAVGCWEALAVSLRFSGGGQNNWQTNPACERHSRNLKTVPCLFKLRDATADGLASWLRATTCCWQRQKLPHVLRWPSRKCESAVASFPLQAFILGGRGPSYN